MIEAEFKDLTRDVDAACRLTGEFTLRSGMMSSTYFDKYLFESDPGFLYHIAGEMVPYIPMETELLAGLEMGGIPLVTMLSHLTGLPALFVRKKAKEHGTAKLIEGPSPAGKMVTLVEDVITTGGAVFDATEALRGPEMAYVNRVICAIDRRTDPGTPLRQINLPVSSVFTKADLDNVNKGQ